MKTIVVFGGNGFIGKNLTAALVAKGWRVRVASRSTANVSDSAANPRLMRADVAKRASVDDVISGADVVFNLASGGGTTWADFERDFISGAKNVAESCLAHGVKLKRAVRAHARLAWDDVAYDAANAAVAFRREMERTFARGGA